MVGTRKVPSTEALEDDRVSISELYVLSVVSAFSGVIIAWNYISVNTATVGRKNISTVCLHSGSHVFSKIVL